MGGVGQGWGPNMGLGNFERLYGTKTAVWIHSFSNYLMSVHVPGPEIARLAWECSGEA